VYREIRSGHNGHHDIREKKMDGFGSILRRHPKGFSRIARPQHRIAFGIKHVRNESQDFHIVIYDEYGFSRWRL
jgi:hypothetical protein